MNPNQNGESTNTERVTLSLSKEHFNSITNILAGVAVRAIDRLVFRNHETSDNFEENSRLIFDGYGCENEVLCVCSEGSAIYNCKPFSHDSTIDCVYTSYIVDDACEELFDIATKYDPTSRKPRSISLPDEEHESGITFNYPPCMDPKVPMFCLFTSFEQDGKTIIDAVNDILIPVTSKFNPYSSGFSLTKIRISFINNEYRINVSFKLL